MRAQAREHCRAISTTPYDKATAIEAWLRANVVYDDQTPAPPQDQDGVAYVLAVKRGYCDYYASAMVVMLRSLGVPARVAVGYAQGQYDSVNGVYHVTEKDSHSWVEVFFPKYGWVEFEPTASQPLIANRAPAGYHRAPPTPGTSSRPGLSGDVADRQSDPRERTANRKTARVCRAAAEERCRASVGRMGLGRWAQWWPFSPGLFAAMLDL